MKDLIKTKLDALDRELVMSGGTKVAPGVIIMYKKSICQLKTQ